METNGNQWGANDKAVGKFERYVLLFVINGNSMVNHWENSNVIFNHSLLMGDHLNITGYILVVLIPIQFYNVSSIPYHWEYSNGT